MSVSVTYTQAEIDALKAAIASGILTVRFSGPPERTVQYQSTQAMIEALSQMVAQTNNAAGTRRSIRVAIVKKGV
jgi:hypothetical protein